MACDPLCHLWGFSMAAWGGQQHKRDGAVSVRRGQALGWALNQWGAVHSGWEAPFSPAGRLTPVPLTPEGHAGLRVLRAQSPQGLLRVTIQGAPAVCWTLALCPLHPVHCVSLFS